MYLTQREIYENMVAHYKSTFKDKYRSIDELNRAANLNAVKRSQFIWEHQYKGM